ncbi:phosphotransferase enzyme family protein [Streptomyces sp. NPDC127068]|uniref:phosphotransferase enzyme family protein n=1 Tax=Streptomyces sp. NPDC127068 TaxID=3347127 RepID=UPI00364FF5F4
MMPLVEINDMAHAVDDDTWCSPVADAVAHHWGCEPGAAKWWRSSASHVFVVPEMPGTGLRAYLRFVPASSRAFDRLEGVAELMDRLADRGTAVVRPLRTTSGERVATVETPTGTVRAMCVPAAPGEETEADDLSRDRARCWGALLAEVHDRSVDLGGGLPDFHAALPRAGELFGDDTALVGAVETLCAHLAELPRDPARYGVVHGDFELDNLAWRGDRATAFDFDEAARSWYAADIASAVRDLTTAGEAGSARHAERLDAFVTGYRTVRPLSDDDLALLPLFTAANAALGLVGLHGVLDAPDDGREDKLSELRRNLLAYQAEQRATVLTVTAGLVPAGAGGPG